MNAFLSTFRTHPSFARTMFSALAVALLIGINGCATKAQVDRLNLAVAHAMLPGEATLAANGEASGAGDWQSASRKIEAFIQANPGQDITIKALRMKQARLLLHHQQFALARAAFEQVQDSQGLYARDQAIWSLSEQLLWWYEFDKQSSLDEPKWQNARVAFGNQIDSLSQDDENEEIHDLLAQMRAHIDCQRIRSLNKALGIQLLATTFDQYTQTLDSADISAVISKAGIDLGETIGTKAKSQARAIQAVNEFARTLGTYYDKDEAIPKPAFSSENSNHLWESLESSAMKAAEMAADEF